MNIALDQVSLIRGSYNVTLFVGRFDPPTKAHIKLITDAYNLYKLPIAIVIVDSKEATFTYSKKMKVFIDCLPNVSFYLFRVQNAFLGNIVDYLRKVDYEPKYFICGTDRVETYKAQLGRYSEKFNLDLELVEIPRTNEDISATKVRKAIQEKDFETFKENMHEKSWNLFDF